MAWMIDVLVNNVPTYSDPWQSHNELKLDIQQKYREMYIAELFTFWVLSACTLFALQFDILDHNFMIIYVKDLIDYMMLGKKWICEYRNPFAKI